MRHYTLISILFFLLPFLACAEEYGMAGFYADDFQGRRTASGEQYDMNKLTAAHKSLPFGTLVRITRMDTRRSITVQINDRGPYIKGRVVDLSRKAARAIGLSSGDTKVKIEVINAETPTEQPKPISIVENPPVEDFTIREDPKPKPPKKIAKVAPKKVAIVPPAPQRIPEEYTAKGAEIKPANVPALKTSKGLYQIKVDRPDNSGFGVQITTLSSYETMMKQVADLQDTFFKEVMVYGDKDAKGASLYKIILGPFPDVATAETMRKKAKKKKLNGFVINLKTMTADVK
jgi:rare lipoprotein A